MVKITVDASQVNPGHDVKLHPQTSVVKEIKRSIINVFVGCHAHVSLRTHEATSAAWARGFNKATVGQFFTLLPKVLADHKFSPTKIFNVNERGITTVQDSLSKVRVSMRPGFPGHVLFLWPCPGGFPEIWLLSGFFTVTRPFPIDRYTLT